MCSHWPQTLMWVTIASVAVYLAYNSAGMYVTEELGAVRLPGNLSACMRSPFSPLQLAAAAAHESGHSQLATALRNYHNLEVERQRIVAVRAPHIMASKTRTDEISV